ncbi:MAG: hypothetical protein IEMM0002_1427 [bacterium]|nr:MAG: hypothetical protein IEMM0002_1427 [bacterium]
MKMEKNSTPHGFNVCKNHDGSYEGLENLDVTSHHNIRIYASEQKSLNKARAGLLEDVYYLDDLAKIDVLCMFTEAFKNAMEHGNRFDADKTISVETWKSVGEITVSIEDEGEGFKNKNKTWIYTDTSKVGLRLIFSLADEISFDSNGRKIIFKKRLSGNNSPFARGQNIRAWISGNPR